MRAPNAHPGFASGLSLWLLRHAEVDLAWRERAYGDLDVPLSAEGVERTRELAEEFRGCALACVYSSPMSRARALGDALAQATAAPLCVVPGLREIHRGAWQGLPIAELDRRDPAGVAAFYADPWRYKGHAGECDAEIHARAWPVVLEAARDHAGKSVVFATHYNVIRVLAGALLGIEPARSFAFRVDPGRATLFEDGPAGWTLRVSNAASPRQCGALG